MLRRETSHCRTQLAETYNREHGNLSLLHPQIAPVAEGRGMGGGRTRMENGWGARERIEKGRPGGERTLGSAWNARGRIETSQGKKTGYGQNDQHHSAAEGGGRDSSTRKSIWGARGRMEEGRVGGENKKQRTERGRMGSDIAEVQYRLR